MPNKKYFIAVVLPPPILSKVEALKEELFLKHGLKGALRSPAHITLHRPFEWREERETKLIECLQGFRFNSSFHVKLHNFSFFEPRVVYVDVVYSEPLNTLYKKIKQHVKLQLNILNEDDNFRGFHPHVTIANRDIKKPLFYQLQNEYTSLSFDAEFNCNSFSLLKLHQKWEVHQSFSLEENY
jgi:2'-5' RNA ligase